MLANGFEFVPFEKIKQADYNFAGARYREITRSKGKWEMVRLGDLISRDIVYAQRGKTITRETIESGNIPVIAGGQSSPYSHNKSTHEGNIITVSASGAYSGYIWYHDYPIWASDCSVFYSKDETKILTKYLYHMLKHQQDAMYKMQNGVGQPHVYIKDIATLYFPLPPLAEQQKLVDALSNIRQSIKSAQDLIQSLKNEGVYLFHLGVRNLRLLQLKILEKLLEVAHLARKIKNIGMMAILNGLH